MSDDVRTSWTIGEMAKAAGVSRRMIRHYVATGALPKVVPRGAATVYGREHWLRLHATRALLKERLSLEEIRRRLDQTSPEELERLAGFAPPPAPAPAESPAPTTPTTLATPAMTRPATLAPPAEAGALSPATDDDAGALPRDVVEPWERIVLLPGLELHLRAGAAPLLRRLAREICERYRSAG